MSGHMDRTLLPGSAMMLEIRLELWQLSDGKSVLKAVRTNGRGVTSTKWWNTTPGNSLSPVISDVMAHVGVSLTDHFTFRGAT